MNRVLARIDVIAIAARCMALLILCLGAARAEAHSSSAERSSAGSNVSGTILAANARELLVATPRGDRVVVKLESRTVGLWDGGSSTTEPRANVVHSLQDVARNAAPLAVEPPELQLWSSSSPMIIPVLGLFAIGTAGAVAVGRRISAVLT
jgi:hypothetical protein